MIKDVELINKHSQIRELGSEAKYGILRELIPGSATCQQLANIFGLSKQKVHYNLNKLLQEKLIEIVEGPQSNAREVYYRATAKNFVLDFSVGQNVNDNNVNSRGIIDRILSEEYRVSLQDIAARLVSESLKLKPRERLMVVTGKYNLPLVEKIQLEAARRAIPVTLLYQDTDLLKAKYEDFSLAAFDADYQNFNHLLGQHQVYLNLNGEARHLSLTDPQKLKLRARHHAKSRQIIMGRNIRVAVMPGLLHDTLSEHAIHSELQFWKALDVDYDQLCRQTTGLCRRISEQKELWISGGQTRFGFRVQKTLAECGSFSDSPWQSPVINLPGGEVLIIPEPRSLGGEISAELAFVYGEKVLRPRIILKDNEIIHHSAESNQHLLDRAIEEGGSDGRKVALVCLGTNENIRLRNIDSSFQHKTRGLVTVYWGENMSLGGSVEGNCEWFLQLEDPKIEFDKGEDHE
jgi:leucyl aminopeptidase (aminopeptidase T)